MSVMPPTTSPAPHGGYRKIQLGWDVEFHRVAARAQILAAYRQAGANLNAAARVLHITERTLHRYVDRLELRPALRRLTREAQRDGWLDPRRRPRT